MRMINIRSNRVGFRLLLGSMSIGLTLLAFNGFTKSGETRWATADKPADGIPGLPETSPGAMDDYIRQIDFGAGADSMGIYEGLMPCGSPAKCGGRESVRLRIVPSNFAPLADWDKALHDGNGHVVAKVTNMESVPYDRLNLGPSELAYVWIGNSQGLGRTAALYTVKRGIVKRIFKFKGRTFCRNSTEKKPAVHVSTPPQCTSTDSKPLPAAMEQASLEPFSAIGSYLVSRITKLNPPPLDLGLWISCSIGCCEVQF